MRFLYLSLLLLSSQVFAQELPDSISNQLKIKPSDSAKIEYLFELSDQFYRSNPQLNFKILDTALDLSEKSGHAHLIADSYRRTGIYYLYQQQFQKADSLYDLALEIYQLQNDSSGLAKIYNEKGTRYYRQYDDLNAIKYWIKAYEILDRIGGQKLLAGVSNNISLGYSYVGDTVKAIQFLRKSIELKKLVDDKRLGSSYQNLAAILERQGKIDSAKFYLQRAIIEKKKNNDLRGLAVSYNSLSVIYMKENIDSTLYYHFKTIDIDEKLGDNKALSEDYQSLADTYVKIENPKEAIKFANKSIAISKNSKLRELNYMNLAKSHQMLGDYKSANVFLQKYLAVHDSIRNSEKERAIVEMKTKFDTDQKEKENQLLVQKNKIQALELGQTRTKLVYSIILMIVLIGVVVMLIFFYRLKKKLLTTEIDELRAKINASLIESGTELDLPLVDFNNRVHNPLTEREFEILKLAISKKPNSQIADEVFVSVNTVKYHLKNIFNKLGVANRNEALEFVTQKT